MCAGGYEKRLFSNDHFKYRSEKINLQLPLIIAT